MSVDDFGKHDRRSLQPLFFRRTHRQKTDARSERKRTLVVVLVVHNRDVLPSPELLNLVVSAEGFPRARALTVLPVGGPPADAARLVKIPVERVDQRRVGRNARRGAESARGEQQYDRHQPRPARLGGRHDVLRRGPGREGAGPGAMSTTGGNVGPGESATMGDRLAPGSTVVVRLCDEALAKVATRRRSRADRLERGTVRTKLGVVPAA